MNWANINNSFTSVSCHWTWIIYINKHEKIWFLPDSKGFSPLQTQWLKCNKWVKMLFTEKSVASMSNVWRRCLTSGWNVFLSGFRLQKKFFFGSPLLSAIRFPKMLFTLQIVIYLVSLYFILFIKKEQKQKSGDNNNKKKVSSLL